MLKIEELPLGALRGWRYHCPKCIAQKYAALVKCAGLSELADAPNVIVHTIKVLQMFMMPWVLSVDRTRFDEIRSRYYERQRRYHGGYTTDPTTHAVTAPIYQTVA